MRDFSITLHSLKNGWAFIKAANDSRDKVFAISYVGGDALSGLIDSAINSLNGYQYQTKFLLEPEEIVFATQPDEHDKILINMGKEVFSCTKANYARQILNFFDSYLHEQSKEEYHKQWHDEFPEQKLQTLRSIFHAQK